jgi:methionyl aminopeptidase
VTIEHEDDLVALKRIGAIVAGVLAEMARAVTIGISTGELDAIGRDALVRQGATSAPQKAYKFPGATCISVNDALAHGIPSDRCVLRDGDLVNIDVSAELDGYWADTGASFAVGTIKPRHQKLLDATKSALAEGMAVSRAGQPLAGIARAVEHRARQSGFSVVENISGHGVGRFIHEAPHVANTLAYAEKKAMWEGLVMTIEPFFTTGARRVAQDKDGWTLRTPDGSLGAQFEHTFVVTKGEPIVLTAL